MASNQITADRVPNGIGVEPHTWKRFYERYKDELSWDHPDDWMPLWDTWNEGYIYGFEMGSRS